jgi:hypothetical protein
MSSNSHTGPPIYTFFIYMETMGTTQIRLGSNEHGGLTHIEERLTLRADSSPNEKLQSLMWVLENDFYVIIVFTKNNVDI